MPVSFLSRILSVAIVCLAFGCVLAPRPAQAEPALETLVILTQQGPRTFEVEVMRTDEERAKGLMFRRYLPADRGMLFDFKETQPVMMWMKDTFIPLDMVFIRKDGTIARVAADTEPHSTRTISSGEPVFGVLEINAGMAAKLGVRPGDKVQHALFGSKP
ncbi:DUF192 domain-containing protein [Alsobacter sp. KACC 23698]|uniref:DUF192 domain-containing protein n=1 Tax=Alsobacter sp. KACC 23698 TaxID=3149229 RepID=A0AAU7J8N7_9HYPH